MITFYLEKIEVIKEMNKNYNKNRTINLLRRR